MESKSPGASGTSGGLSCAGVPPCTGALNRAWTESIHCAKTTRSPSVAISQGEASLVPSGWLSFVLIPPTEGTL